MLGVVVTKLGVLVRASVRNNIFELKMFLFVFFALFFLLFCLFCLGVLIYIFELSKAHRLFLPSLLSQPTLLQLRASKSVDLSM